MIADHEHVWGALEHSRLAGTVHRKCTIYGCKAVKALEDDDDVAAEEAHESQTPKPTTKKVEIHIVVDGGVVTDVSCDDPEIELVYTIDDHDVEDIEDTPEECDECGAVFPNNAPDILGSYHKDSCSLYEPPPEGLL